MSFLVSEEGIALKKLLEFIEECREIDEVGGIAVFLGVVRGKTHSGENVERLDFEAYKEKAEEAFARIAEEVKERHGALKVLIHHAVGRVEVGGLIMLVAVAGRSRKEVFPALSEAVERVKREAPIWKKETLKDGRSYWVEYA